LRITRNQPVTVEKRDRARQLRRKMTPEERTLWRELRSNALSSTHFRRQQVIAGFIVDFYCASAQLAVEVDGPAHLSRREYDRDRDSTLARMGIRTLRLSNRSITRELASVLRKIAREITSPLTPLPPGEGKPRSPNRQNRKQF
jgi:very-short-patch-repair endonuclease